MTLSNFKLMIKSAVTISKLMGTAKQHGIPLIGDWRYAARLLSKQTQTPAGKAHYDRVVGFANEPERAALKTMHGMIGSRAGYAAARRALGQGEVPRLQAIFDAGQKPKPLPPRDSEVWKRKLTELGLSETPVSKMKPALGREGTVELEPGSLRTIHTHPAAYMQSKNMPRHRRTPLGVVFPSSFMDAGVVHPEKVVKVLQQLNAGKYVSPKGKVLDGFEAVKKFRQLAAKTEKVPVDLSQAVNLLKRRINNKMAPSNLGYIGTSGDVGATIQGLGGKHSIISPELGTESVMKGRLGKLLRLYFKQGDPL
jgi:hypothetical protein